MSTAIDNQISCRFLTKLPAKYKVPPTEIAVPANLTRYGLSQVVNHLLNLENAVPFDFLVGRELVRLSLGKLLLAQNLSTEKVLEVEYFLAVTPPEQKEQLPHDDWVSAIDGSRKDAILSGCYDGLLRIWNGKGEVQASLSAHKGPISAVRAVPTAERPLVLTAGKLDHVIRLLEIPSQASHESRQVGIYKGHGGSVLDVAAAPSGERFVSASQDKNLRVWPTEHARSAIELIGIPRMLSGMDALSLAAGDAMAAEAAEKGTAPSTKRLKLKDGGKALIGGVEVEPSFELMGHTDAATSVTWTAGGHIYSGSMDHSVRKWDAETGVHVDTHTDRRAISCIATPPGPGNDIVAFAGASNAVQLWDPRKRQAEDAGIKSFVSHKSHIHAVLWHPKSANHLLSASMDKTLKLWDLRSGIPLHTLEGHTDQVLCAAWWGAESVVSGGADSMLKIFKLKVNV